MGSFFHFLHFRLVLFSFSYFYFARNVAYFYFPHITAALPHVDLPHLVTLLMIEESKPRLCNDSRFLNLCIKDTPFNLIFLSGLTRHVTSSSIQSVCVDKFRYDHVLPTPESLVTLSRLAGNLRLIFTILLDFSPLIIFVLFLYLASCTSMIATQGKFSYPPRFRPSSLYPRNLKNPPPGYLPPFL